MAKPWQVGKGRIGCVVTSMLVRNIIKLYIYKAVKCASKCWKMTKEQKKEKRRKLNGKRRSDKEKDIVEENAKKIDGKPKRFPPPPQKITV